VFVGAGIEVYAEHQDPQARSIAEVLGGMAPEFAQKVLGDESAGGLSKAQLDSIVHAASQQRDTTSMTGASYKSSEAGPLGRLLTQAAGIEDTGTKARLFQAATGVLKEVTKPWGEGAAGESIRSGLGQLLASDTNGMVNELRLADPDGGALAAYMKDAIQNKDFNAISLMQVQLMVGNDGTGNHIARMNDAGHHRDGEPDNVHAKDAGYFAGALGAAVQGVAKSKDEQAELLTNVVKSVLGVIGAGTGILKVAGPIYAGVVGAVGESIGPTIKAFFIEHPEQGLEEQLRKAFIPSERNAEGRLQQGAIGAYNDARRDTQEAAARTLQ
jgi:hypothetical protein